MVHGQIRCIVPRSAFDPFLLTKKGGTHSYSMQLLKFPVLPPSPSPEVVSQLSGLEVSTLIFALNHFVVRSQECARACSTAPRRPAPVPGSRKKKSEREKGARTNLIVNQSRDAL